MWEAERRVTEKQSRDREQVDQTLASPHPPPPRGVLRQAASYPHSLSGRPAAVITAQGRQVAVSAQRRLLAGDSLFLPASPTTGVWSLFKPGLLY